MSNAYGRGCGTVLLFVKGQGNKSQEFLVCDGYVLLLCLLRFALTFGKRRPSAGQGAKLEIGSSQLRLKEKLRFKEMLYPPPPLQG